MLHIDKDNFPRHLAFADAAIFTPRPFLQFEVLAVFPAGLTKTSLRAFQHNAAGNRALFLQWRFSCRHQRTVSVLPIVSTSRDLMEIFMALRMHLVFRQR